ncbi:MAG: hypothetical protein ABIK62_01675 [candidate division WOR-3 bacterium]
MVCTGPFLYALKGNNTLEFMVYQACNDTTLGSDYNPPDPDPNEEAIKVSEAIQDPAWRPSGSDVCYVRPDDQGVDNVFRIQADGTHEKQLTFFGSGAECSQPVWSPSDTLIAFTVSLPDSAYSQMGVVNVNDYQVRILTSAGDCENPAWSPAADWIAYQKCDTTTYWQIYLVSPNGGQEKVLTCDQVDHEQPCFVSSTKVAYAREGPTGHQEIYTTEGGSEQQLTWVSADHENPDAAHGTVVFEELDQYGNTQIVKACLGSNAEVVLTPGGASFESPAIDPTGTYVHCVVLPSPVPWRT